MTTTETAPPPGPPPPETRILPPIWQVRRFQPRPELPGLAVAVIEVLMACCLVAFFLFAFALGIGGLQAERGNELHYSDLRESLAEGTAPTGGAIDPGTPVALLTVPRIKVNEVVVEGTAAEDLRAGPGHRRDTPLPGQPGTSVVFGRAVMFGGPFLRIRTLAQGDVITVTTAQGTFNYAVDDVRREGDPLPDPVAAGGARITLISAEGVSWRDGWAPDRMIYVDATMQGKPVADPGGRPTIIPVQEKAMASDSSAWIAVVLWLQVLAIGAFGAAWAQARWGGAQAWLTFVPIILVGLWGACDGTLQLLPNVM
jgi:sortase A